MIIKKLGEINKRKYFIKINYKKTTLIIIISTNADLV